MPAGKIYKSQRKRKYRKKKKGNNVTPGTVVTLGRQPFPASLITKHRYVSTVLINPGIAAAATYDFNAIGMYDPDPAVGGHSVLGFTELKGIYDHYQVLGSKITVKAISTAATSSDACMVGVYVNDDNSPVTTYDTIQEQGNGTSRILTNSAATGYVSFSHKFSTKKFFGCKDVIDREDLKGGAASNPSDNAYFIVWAQSLNSGGDPSGIYANVQIDYIAKWTEPNDLAQS